MKQDDMLRQKPEDELSIRLNQQEAVASFGEYAVGCLSLDELFQEAVVLTGRVLDVEMCKVLELLPEEKELLLRSGIGWKEGLVGSAVVGAGKDSQAGYTLLSDEPVIVEDLRGETRFSGPQLLIDHNVISGISVIIHGKDRPFGVMGAHTAKKRQFSHHDTRFLRSIANILASAVDRFLVEEDLRHSRDELSIILNGVSEGITVQDAAGNLVFANQAAAEISGFSTADEMLETPVSQVLRKFVMLDVDGNPFPYDRLPGRLVLQGEPKASAQIRFRSLATGQEHYSIVDATPVYDKRGNVVQAVNIFRDITEMVFQQRSQRLLAEAGDLLASSLDYETTLVNVAKLAVNDLADWCTVHLMTEDEKVVQLIAAHKDPSKMELAQQYQEKYPADTNSDRGVAQVLKTGQPLFFPEISDELLEAGARDAEHLELLRRLGFQSAMIVPLVANNRTFGAISLIWSDSGRRYNQNDVDLVNELARRAAIAVENARLYRESREMNARLEQRVASRTQQLEISNNQLLREIDEKRKAEAALRKSEALLNSLFESAPDATILVNRVGKMVLVNRQVEIIFDYQREELIGKQIDVLFPERFRAIQKTHRQEYTENPASSPTGAGLELAAVRKDGTEFPVDIMFSPVPTEEGNLVISAIRDITEQKRLQTELAETHRRLFESIEAERLMLSQELHDGPIQELYAVTISLETLPENTQTEDDHQELEHIKDSVQNVIQTLRGICGELRPTALSHFGLEKAIRSHLIKVQETHPELEIETHLMNDGRKLPERIRLGLYRVYQNSISNILRHAQASHVSVEFQIEDNTVRMQIRDNGKGFAVPKKWVELARAGHFGLVGMSERVEALGGNMTLVSSPGKGTTIQVQVPIEEN